MVTGVIVDILDLIFVCPLFLAKSSVRSHFMVYPWVIMLLVADDNNKSILCKQTKIRTRSQGDTVELSYIFATPLHSSGVFSLLL